MKKLSIVAFVFALAGVFASNVISRPLIQTGYAANDISNCVQGTVVGTDCGPTGTTQCKVKVTNSDMTTSNNNGYSNTSCTSAFKRNP